MDDDDDDDAARTDRQAGRRLRIPAVHDARRVSLSCTPFTSSSPPLPLHLQLSGSAGGWVSTDVGKLQVQRKRR